MTRLLVLVTHYSRGDLLPATLESVREWPVQVLDDSPAGVRGRVPVPVVRLPGNSGFANAANAGLRLARQAGILRVLLLNDDAVPQPGCVEALVQAMEADPRLAAAGPLLRGLDGRVESAGIRLHDWSGRVRALRDIPPGPRDVDALSGACLLLDSQVRFDGRYRFYFEDIELCRRLRAAGRGVRLVPAARCLHHGGATVSRRSQPATRHAVAGHLRLVGRSPLRRGLVVGLAAAQVLREGGPPARFMGIWQGLLAP